LLRLNKIPSDREPDVIRVFVLIETRLYREGIARALDEDARFVISGMAGDLPAAFAAIDTLGPPDVLLLDHAIPEGVSAARRLREKWPGLRIVALAVREANDEVIPWAEAGVAGFVPSSASLEELLAGMAAVAAGDGLCSPRLAAVLLDRVAALAAERRPARAIGGLTLREQEIVLLLEEGLSNKEIATRLSIQVATVKHHVHSILEKLQVRRRGEAASLVRSGSGSRPVHVRGVGPGSAREAQGSTIQL
jgi:DNA-binding NarL/FixJ family response regulator